MCGTKCLFPNCCNVGRLFGKPFLTNNIEGGEEGKEEFGPNNVCFHVKNWSMVEAVHSASLSHIILARIVGYQQDSSDCCALALTIFGTFSENIISRNYEIHNKSRFFFRVLKNSCRTCHYELTCSKASLLQARGIVDTVKRIDIFPV